MIPNDMFYINPLFAENHSNSSQIPYVSVQNETYAGSCNKTCF